MIANSSWLATSEPMCLITQNRTNSITCLISLLAAKSSMMVYYTASKKSGTHPSPSMPSSPYTATDMEVHPMTYKDITIQTRPRKRNTVNSYAFRCQLITVGNTRTYLLSETKRELERRHIFLLPGCKIIDDGVAYRILDIWYSPRPMQPFVIVYRDYAV